MNEYLMFRQHINYDRIPKILSLISDKECYDFLQDLYQHRNHLYFRTLFSSKYNVDGNRIHCDYLKVVSTLKKFNLFFEEPFTYCYNKYPYNFLEYLGLLGLGGLLKFKVVNFEELENAFDNSGEDTVENLRFIRESLFENNMSVSEIAEKLDCSEQTIYNRLKYTKRKLELKSFCETFTYPSEIIYSNDHDFKMRPIVRNKLKEELSYAMFDKGIIPTLIQKYVSNKFIYISIIEMTIEELDLSVRSFNFLKRAGINTLSDLISLDSEELTHVRNLGKRSFDEVIEKLQNFGINLDYDYGLIEGKYTEFPEIMNCNELDMNHKIKLYFIMRFLRVSEKINIKDFLSDSDTFKKLINLISDNGNFNYDSVEGNVLSNKFIWAVFGDSEHSHCLTNDEKGKMIDFIIDNFALDSFSINDISPRLYDNLSRLGYMSLGFSLEYKTDVVNCLKLSADTMTQIEFDKIINNTENVNSCTITNVLSISSSLLKFLYKNDIDSFHALVLHYFDDFKHCVYCSDLIKEEVKSIMDMRDIERVSDSFDLYTHLLSDESEPLKDLDVEVVRCSRDNYQGGASGYTVYVTVKNKLRKNLNISVNDIYLIQENEQIKRKCWLSGYAMIGEKIPPKSLKTAAAIFYDSTLRNNDLRYSKVGVSLRLRDAIESREYIFSYDFANDKWCQSNYDDIL